MKIFLVLSSFPYAEGEAIEVVANEVIGRMAGQGHSLDVQVLIRDPRGEYHDKRSQWAKTHVAGPRVQFLDPLYLGDRAPAVSRVMRSLGALWDLIWSLPLLRGRINLRLFPASALKQDVRRRVEKSRPDVILSIWSWEALAATYDITNVRKFVYYGNPDQKPQEARLESPDLFNIPSRGLFNRISLWKRRLVMKALGIQHIRMMNRCEVTANNSWVDTAYYRENGHPQSLYLHNMWSLAKNEPVFGGNANGTPPYAIVANVGNLGATGNTFGLYYLGRELAPRLEKKLGVSSIALDVYGGGTPSAAVRQALSRPSIRLKGWVNDLEKEILNACAFLVLTNVSGFIVGNTRILLAWSLGSCLIAHKNSSLSMPEIVHGENALLGETPDELAHWVETAVKEPELRRRVGRGGYETFQKYFRSDIVVPQMLREMERLVSGAPAAGVPS